MPLPPRSTFAAMRGRAEVLLAKLRAEGKAEEVVELESLLATLDATSGTESAMIDRLIDWIYEHEA